jgi:predicted acyltransferase
VDKTKNISNPNIRIMTNPIQINQAQDRILSVDFFRGLTMFLLIGESTEIYSHFQSIQGSSIMQFLGTQFSHHEWNGLHFWDLIQPFFMFIVGVAIPFAVANRQKKGDTDRKILLHALRRSALLLFFGWALYCMEPGKIVFRLQNVLAQLSVTYLVAFLIMKKSFSFQLIFTLIILLITDLAYRYFPVEGFNHPWVPYENLGAWANNKIEGVDKASIWASINAIPTIAHTVWGVLFGQLLRSDREVKNKIRIMIIAGLSGLIIGYSLDFLHITPIIKKIATSSFVFASGGWAILALAFSYWLIDVRKIFTATRFFIIVGMNSIFIYLFFSLGGAEVLRRFFTPFSTTLFGWGGEITVAIIASLFTWAAQWYLCFWLYKNKLFIKI